MAWIESHQSLQRHRKTIRAAGRLSVDRATLVGHLHFLWWWALDNVGADGCLGDMEPFEIAEAAEWSGDPDVFVEGLVEAGFVDREGDSLALHDWYDYAGKLIEARERERERSRERRAKAKRKRKDADNESEGRPSVDTNADQKTTGGRPPVATRSTVGTVPNHTVPNHKRETRARAHARGDASDVDAEEGHKDSLVLSGDFVNSDNSPTDGMAKVAKHYNSKIGIIGKSGFDRIAFWHDEQDMNADLVCMAIDRAVEQAERPGVAYIEGVLRNWSNANIRTVSDLRSHEDARASPKRRSGSSTGRKPLSAMTSEEIAALGRGDSVGA